MPLTPSPYSYEQSQPNPYMRSIGELMLRQGDIRAQEALQLADINAKAITGVTGAIAAIPGQMQQQKVAGQEAQLRQGQIDEMTQKRNDLKALDTAFQSPGGPDAVLKSLPGHLQMTVGKALDEQRKAHAEAEEAQGKADVLSQDAFGNSAASVVAFGNDPVAAQVAISDLKLRYANNPERLKQLQQAEQAIQANPTAETVGKITDAMIQASPKRVELQQKAAELAATIKKNAEEARHNIATEGRPIDVGPNTNLVTPTGETIATGQTPRTLEAKSVLLDGKPTEAQFDAKAGAWFDASGHPIQNAATRVKPIPPASSVQLLPSGDALDMAAKKYLATGDLPSMGMGQAGVAARIAVMNRAAQIDPQASLAANKATYKADSTNLTNLQRTEGTLSAFENTAGKNLDQFLTLANKIPDIGVPWLNTPIRMLDEKLVGSQNMAAINAARDVALREIARVTNDPKLSGALTDTARKEVSALSPRDATLPQIKAVVKVLKQDMANVHAGLTQQIESVKSGLGSNPAAPAGGGPAKGATRTVNGVNYTWNGSEWVK